MIALTTRYRRILKVFGKRLQLARKTAGFESAQQFAHRLGVEPHTYRTYERGTSQPNLETLTRICELLDVTPNDLLPEAAGAGTRRKDDRETPDMKAT